MNRRSRSLLVWQQYGWSGGDSQRGLVDILLSCDWFKLTGCGLRFGIIKETESYTLADRWFVRHVESPLRTGGTGRLSEWSIAAANPHKMMQMLAGVTHTLALTGCEVDARATVEQHLLHTRVKLQKKQNIKIKVKRNT